MTTIQLEIENCSFCPFIRFSGYGAQSWTCRKKAVELEDGRVVERLIGSQIEYDEYVPSVPDWCPCRVDASKNEEEETV